MQLPVRARALSPITFEIGPRGWVASTRRRDRRKHFIRCRLFLSAGRKRDRSLWASAWSWSIVGVLQAKGINRVCVCVRARLQLGAFG